MHKYANIKKSILLRFFAKISKSRIAASESFQVPVRQTDDLGKIFEQNKYSSIISESLDLLKYHRFKKLVFIDDF